MSKNQKLNFPQKYPVACHTDNVCVGGTFVAIKGFNFDGANYIPLALKNGASRIVIQKDSVIPEDVAKLIIDSGAKLEKVEDTRKALAQMSAKALDFPASKLSFIGITGTKGKTSTTYLTEHILRFAGHKTAMLSTVENKINGQSCRSTLTTQQPDYLHVFFNECVKQGVKYVVMEVAAQALSLHRTFGIEFESVLFSNFSLEHSEFYSTQDDYFKAKCLLFDQVKRGGAVFVNSDDEFGRKILSANPSYKSFSIKDKTADSFGFIKNASLDGLCIDFFASGGTFCIECPSLVGQFNAYNIIGASCLALSCGVLPSQIVDACKRFTSVAGRLERYALPNGAYCFIDYAHNPASYDAVLSTVRKFTHNLIVVFGAGGDRDKSKRSLMGKVAAEYADFIVLTSDNPRSESTLDIINDIKEGICKNDLEKVFVEVDREKAILKAYETSQSKSIIMLLGKGPDEYQIVNGVKNYFSEAQIIKSKIQ